MRSAALALAAFAAGCQPVGDDDTGPEERAVAFQGAAHKGPFVVGSAVQINVLDHDGDQTGESFSTSTTNDRGEFALNLTTVVPTGAEIATTGFYFNEVTGVLGAASITLRSLTEITTAGSQTTYVNVLTHLAHRRALALHRGGLDVGAATAQAQAEMRDALGLYVPPGIAAAEDVNLLGGDTDDTAYLLAVSCVLGQAAVEEVAGTASSTEARLQEILNGIAIDLEDDGAIGPLLEGSIATGLAFVDGDGCEERLRERLAALGDTTTVVPDLGRVLDLDRDGTPDADDPDDDGDGVLEDDEALVKGISVDSRSTEFRREVVVVLDNIVDGHGGQAWVAYVDDTTLPVYRPYAHRIETPAGVPLTGITDLHTGFQGFPVFLRKDDGTVWRWEPGERATQDTGAPADVAALRAVSQWYVYAVTADHEWYSFGDDQWTHEPGKSGLVAFDNADGWTTVWVHANGTSSGTPMPVPAIDAMSWYRLGDDGLLYDASGTPLTVPTGVRRVLRTHYGNWAIGDTEVWKQQGPFVPFDAPTDVSGVAGQVFAWGAACNALLGVDGRVYFVEILDDGPTGGERSVAIPR